MVAAAESAEVIARWTPLEKNGSINAIKKSLSAEMGDSGRCCPHRLHLQRFYNWDRHTQELSS